MSAILYSTDLFFSSRVTASAEAAGRKMSVVGSDDGLRKQLSSEIELVLLDLTVAPDFADIIREIRGDAENAKIIAFGPHVAVNKLAAANENGCDVVMTRGQFDQQLPTLF